MERKTRKPMQKRALDKVARIIDAAFTLFNEKGYYNTTTEDIAKQANVATGSLYSYFKDKKDIYIKVQEKIYKDIFYPSMNFWINNDKPLNNYDTAKNLFSAFLKLMLKSHNFSKLFHDESEALKLLDEDIRNISNEHDAYLNEKIDEMLINLSIPFKSKDDMEIFLHFCLLLIDDVCHKICYDNTLKDMNLYMDKCTDMICTLFMDTTNFPKE